MMTTETVFRWRTSPIVLAGLVVGSYTLLDRPQLVAGFGDLPLSGVVQHDTFRRQRDKAATLRQREQIALSIAGVASLLVGPHPLQ